MGVAADWLIRTLIDLRDAARARGDVDEAREYQERITRMVEAREALGDRDDIDGGGRNGAQDGSRGPFSAAVINREGIVRFHADGKDVSGRNSINSLPARRSRAE